MNIDLYAILYMRLCILDNINVGTGIDYKFEINYIYLYEISSLPPEDTYFNYIKSFEFDWCQ